MKTKNKTHSNIIGNLKLATYQQISAKMPIKLIRILKILSYCPFHCVSMLVRSHLSTPVAAPVVYHFQTESRPSQCTARDKQTTILFKLF